MIDIILVYSICTIMCIINCCLKIYERKQNKGYPSDDESDDESDIEIVYAEPIRSESEVHVKVILTINDMVD